MIDDGRDEPAFDGDPDWRFPLRLGLLPTAEGQELGDELFGAFQRPVKDLVTRVNLAVDGFDCDIVLVTSAAELDVLVTSLTLSANLVLLLDPMTSDFPDDQVAAATQAVGASGYAAALGNAFERVSSFLYELSHRATISQALERHGGSYEVVGNPLALATPPVAAFLEQVASLDADAGAQADAEAVLESAPSSEDVGAADPEELFLEVGGDDSEEMFLDHGGDDDELEEALRIRNAQLSVFERVGDARSIAITWSQIADIADQRRNFDEALRIRNEQVLPVLEDLGDYRSIAITWSQIADTADRRGDYDQALDIYVGRVLPVIEDLGDVRELAITWSRIADVRSLGGDDDEALRIRIDQVLPVFEGLGDARSVAFTWDRIATIADRRGDDEEARRIRNERVLPVLERLGEPEVSSPDEESVERNIFDDELTLPRPGEAAPRDVPKMSSSDEEFIEAGTDDDQVDGLEGSSPEYEEHVAARGIDEDQVDGSSPEYEEHVAARGSENPPEDIELRTMSPGSSGPDPGPPGATGAFEVEVTPEMGGGQAASDLGLVVGARVDAVGTARTLTGPDADRFFHHETDGASVASVIGRDASVAAALDRRRAEPTGRSRFLQTELQHRVDGKPGGQVRHGFLRGRPMLILVGIGPAGPTRMVSNVPLDEQQLGTPGPGGWNLEITLKPDVGDIQRQAIELPLTGGSADAEFPVDVDPAASQWRGRITVWHRGHAIQSAILSGPVIEDDVDPGNGQRPSLVVDGEFRPMAELDGHTPGGAAIELDEHPALYTENDGWTIEPREDEVRRASNGISQKLGEMAVDLDEAASLDDDAPRRLLLYLAVQGSLLLDALFTNKAQRDAVIAEPFLQALRLSDAAPELPYEFIYDLPSPPSDFELCTQWRDGIEARACPRCHADGANNRDVLCPLGFWGLRKVIERHNAVEQGEGRAQARLRRGDVAGKKTIEVASAALAMSDKADTIPRGAPADYVLPSTRVRDALAANALPAGEVIKEWSLWEDTIKTVHPGLLIILGHAVFDSERGEWTMQIGAGDDLFVSRVFEEFVHAPPGTPGPVVFLFGCLTASEGSEQATFVRQFRKQNASVVIGTTSTVLGRQAGPVAAGLINSIRANAGAESIGELLRRARATGLAEGSLMAMALNAFGDADHRLTIKGAA